MEILNSEKIISSLILRARSIRGNYGNFCDSSGVDISWFSKFINGRISNPTIKSLETLDKAMSDWDK